MNKLKKVIPVIIAFIIGISTTVGATTVFNSKDITYSSNKTKATNVKDSLDELYGKVGKCPEGLSCINKDISEIVEIGDYISMTPISTSYTPPKELTGCMNDGNCTQNTINPSELNLWRVIRKNEDGTIDVVSEYVSSKGVQIYGKVGYMNYVGILNQVSAQYTNEKYVQKTRHMGYSNQIESCPTFLDCPVDNGFETDVNLVQMALKTLLATTKTGQSMYYMLSSRSYRKDDPVTGYNVIFVDQSGKQNITHSLKNEYDGKEYVIDGTHRPILTLKADIEIISGDGKSEKTAYILQ